MSVDNVNVPNSNASSSSFALSSITLLLVLSLISVAAVADTGPVAVRRDAPTAKKLMSPNQTAKKPGDVVVSSSNPYLSYLPVEVRPDHDGWRTKIHMESQLRRAAKLESIASGRLTQFAISQIENEPVGVKGLNDLPIAGFAEAVIGFGTGPGDEPEVDISGDLKGAGSATEFFPNAEDDGDINKASATGLADQDAVTASATVGDGPFGSVNMNFLPTGIDAEDDGSIPSANVTGVTALSLYFEDAEIGDGPYGSGSVTESGDFDFYSFTLATPETINIDLFRADGELDLRPILGIYSSDGTLQLSYDDIGFEGAIYLSVDFPAGTWYVAVGGNLNFDSAPDDEFLSDTDDSGSGPGVGSEGFYTLVLTSPISGDFDFYEFSANEFDSVEIEVDTDAYGGVLDPIVAVFDSAGSLVSFNDDDPAPEAGGQSTDSRLSLTIPLTGTYYAAVGGFSVFPMDADSFPADAFDSSTGPGFGSEGDYDIIIARNAEDLDFYSFDLAAGDIIAANTTGSAQLLVLYDENVTLLNGSILDVAGIYPASSLLPGGGVASTAYIVNTAGTYFAGVAAGEGPYTIELRGFRPPQEATRITQKLFLDFDGATLDTRIYGPDGIDGATLSPLSSFLAGWGLLPQDESALIDGIISEVSRALDDDIRLNGLNDAFDIEILNSRDDADPFGDPDVSRVIIGGTRAESGIDTIGIAQSVDVGNFDQSETALVLLDHLSDVDTGNPNSLNQFSVDPGASTIDLVAAGVGNIASHEAGHFFANFHTNNMNLTNNLMDTGGNLPGIVGVGADEIWGTEDDESVAFVTDEYDPFEGFFGIEDTKNSIAFGLTASPNQVGEQASHDVTALIDVNGDSRPDLASLGGDAVSAPRVDVYSGETGDLIKSIDFINDKWRGVAVGTISNANLDGVSDDPAVAMLVVNRTTSKIRVESRRVDNGAFISSIQFFNENWRAVDIVVVMDPNGNGGVDDAAIGVLAERISDGRVQFQLRALNSGSLVSNTVYLNARWTPIAAAIGFRNGFPPRIAVIAEKADDGRRVLQSREAVTGAFDRNIKVLGSAWNYHDVSFNIDGNSDNFNDAPVWVVLATRASDNVIRMQSWFADTGTFHKNLVVLSPNWKGFRMDVGFDMSGNNSEELLISAERRADGVQRIHVKDYLTGGTTLNIATQ